MKTTLALVAALAFLSLSAPALAAGPMSLVDHPDIPNCTILGPNADNCENYNANKSIVASIFTSCDPCVEYCPPDELRE